MKTASEIRQFVDALEMNELCTLITCIQRTLTQRFEESHQHDPFAEAPYALEAAEATLELAITHLKRLPTQFPQ